LESELFSPSPSPDLSGSLKLRPAEDIAGTWRDPALAHHLWAILLRESLPALLRFEDRNSMAFSIEARVPLLDRHLVELAMRLPVQQKIRGGRLKAVLREAVREAVPQAILDRRDKIGFAAPTVEWMGGALAAWWRDLFASQSFRERGCFNPKGVEQLTTRFDMGDANAAVPIWRMAIVEQWARQFLDGGTQQ
jgi:asparagine synthase (glutamine-hydrolysing)